MRGPTNGAAPCVIDPMADRFYTGAGEATKGFVALLVEDNPIIALDLESMVQAQGATEIIMAATVAEALSVLETRRIDIALLDVMLGDEPAFAVAEKLTALGAPFALSTGVEEVGLVAAVFAGKPVLSKPFAADELRDMLALLLRKREQA